jgi:8-oxo-dGTP pyrophosphatase MutT (NUDIX family)
VEVTHQVSAGGVIVREVDVTRDRFELCLIRPKESPAWALPKGRVEPGETDAMTALREVREETGLDGKLGDDLGTIDYEFFSRSDRSLVCKSVHFFLITATGGDTSRHDHEVAEAVWLDVERAFDRMTYPNEREIVRKARRLLTGRK